MFTTEMQKLAHILVHVGSMSRQSWKDRDFKIEQQFNTRASETMDWAASSDREYDEMALHMMNKAFGVDRALTEEGAKMPERNCMGGLRIVEDIHDGTSNYGKQRMDFSGSIAIERDGVVELAGIVTPARGELLVAAPGEGTWFLNWYGEELSEVQWAIDNGNFRQITVNEYALQQAKTTKLGALAIASCYVHSGKRRNFELSSDDKLNTFYARLGNPGCTFCCTVALVEVALGKSDGALVEYQNHWDYAAGQLLVREADGKFFAFSRDWKRVLGAADFSQANATKTADGDEWLCHVVAARTPELAHAIIEHFAGTTVADAMLTP